MIKPGVGNQSGIALLLVLMLTAVLATVVTVYQYRNRANIDLATQAADYLQARARLTSVKEELIFTIMTTPLWIEPPNAARIAELNLPAQFNFFGTPFNWLEADISITDTAALVSVHPFEEAAWYRLLQYIGAEQPDRIISELKDWYDEDSFLHLNGAEASDYTTPGLPRNGMPQTSDELAMVKSFGQYWPQIRPYVSFIGAGVLSYDYMPDKLLPAFFGAERAKQLVDMRAGDVDEELRAMIIPRDEDSNVFLSQRLQITIDVKYQTARYRETFTLLKSGSTQRISVIADRKPGYLEP